MLQQLKTFQLAKVRLVERSLTTTIKEGKLSKLRKIILGKTVVKKMPHNSHKNYLHERKNVPPKKFHSQSAKDSDRSTSDMFGIIRDPIIHTFAKPPSLTNCKNAVLDL